MAETALSRGADFRGHIDFFGYHPGAGGLVCGGWVSHAAAEALPDAELVLGFEERDIAGRGSIGFFPREGLGGIGVGMVLFVPAAGRPAGEFFSITTREHGGRLAVTPSEGARECDPDALARFLAPIAPLLAPPLPEALLRALLPPARPPPRPLDQLAERVLIEVDHAIHCPPHGIALIGWLLARPGAVQGLSVVCGERRAPLALIRLPRPAVIEQVGRGFGFEDVRCGFIGFAADAITPGTPTQLEVETPEGPGLRPLPAPKLTGMAAIRLLLADCDAQFADLAPVFETVLGPAVAALQAERRRVPPSVERVDFGTLPASPAATIVVPLHARLDFLELQLALLARDPASAGWEVLYVLDDPPLRREAENLAASAFARFALPLRLLLPDRNVGFAAACNLGLAEARGAHVCFLNSDAFPLADGWLTALIVRLEAESGLGLVGPLLLDEDGAVQHQGVEFRRQPRFADWYFSHHTRLGLRPPIEGGLHRAAAITGACVVMPTALARRLGGFDEDFVVGDFEDSDLCLRAREAGFAAAVDFDVRLLHLGRRSLGPTAERWRMNLVLYNAWRHQRRWAPAIAALAS
jgi:GT2 family glycosyltransferase